MERRHPESIKNYPRAKKKKKKKLVLTVVVDFMNNTLIMTLRVCLQSPQKEVHI